MGLIILYPVSNCKSKKNKLIFAQTEEEFNLFGIPW